MFLADEVNRALISVMNAIARHALAEFSVDMNAPKTATPLGLKEGRREKPMWGLPMMKIPGRFYAYLPFLTENNLY